MSEKEIHKRLIGNLRKLFSEGEGLRRLPDYIVGTDMSVSPTISVPISMLKDEWIKKTISYLFENFPMSIIKTDFSEITAISEKLATNILSVNYTDDIERLLSCLGKCGDFLLWFSSFDECRLLPNDKAVLSYNRLKQFLLYVKTNVLPLCGKEDGQTANTAVLHLYGRIVGLVQSVTKLNSMSDCYLLVASLRMLLELYIDVLLIKGNCIANGIEKFFSHNELYKYRTANNLVRIDQEIGKSENNSFELNKSLENADQKKQTIQDIWKCDKAPDHWSKMKLEARAKSVDCLNLYRDSYYYGNMFIHSGYTVNPRNSDESHTFCSYVYYFFMDIFHKTTLLMCSGPYILESKEVVKEVKLFYLSAYFQFWKTLSKN